MNKVFGLLRLNLSLCDQHIKEAEYTGLASPMLEYASIIWDPYTANLSNEIEKVHRKVFCFVTFALI